MKECSKTQTGWRLLGFPHQGDLKRTMFFPSFGALCLLLLFFPMAGLESAYALPGEPQGPVRGRLSATAGEIRLPLSIPQGPTVQRSETGDRVSLPGFPTGGSPGEPALPLYSFDFVLPENIEWNGIEVSVENPVWELIAGEMDIAPAPPPATASMEPLDGGTEPLGQTRELTPGRNDAVYGANEWFPAAPAGKVEPGRYHRWNVGRLTLHPVQFHPIQKNLRILRSGTLVIRFAPAAGPAATQPTSGGGDEEAWGRIAPQLENPDSVTEYYDQPAVARDMALAAVSPNFIILTTRAIQNASTMLAPFTAHKESLGYSVAVITEGAAADDAHYLSGGTGNARAQNVRAWLQNRYASWGIEQVLLIGNPNPSPPAMATSVPMFPCNPREGGGEMVPTDMAYSDLSGNWDLDGDGRLGELGATQPAGCTGDFCPGGADKFGEVSVGRIPFYGNNAATLDAILLKTIAYESNASPEAWRRRLLIPAAITNHAPQDGNGDGDTTDAATPEEYASGSLRTFGADWGDEMRSLASLVGFNSHTLLEKQGIYKNGTAFPLAPASSVLNTTRLLTEWKSGYGFVTVMGTGDATHVYRRVWVADLNADQVPQFPADKGEIIFPVLFESSQCSVLDDSRPSHVVLTASRNGEPEIPNNLGFSLLAKGAVSTLSSSRDIFHKTGGWTKDLGKVYGDNASYAHAIFSMMGNGEKIGNGLNRARGQFGLGWGWQSWNNMLAFNIYGDPSLELRAPNLEVAAPASQPAAGTFQGPIDVSLSSATPGAAIHFTLDNSEPTESSPAYTGPIRLEGSATLQAKAFLSGFSSALFTGTFTIRIAATGLDVVTVPNFNRNGTLEVAVLEVADQLNRVSILDSMTGAVLGRMSFLNGSQPGKMVSYTHQRRKPTAIAMLGVDGTGTASIEAKDCSGESIFSIGLTAGRTPVDMAVLPDRNRNRATELAVLSMDQGTGEVLVDIHDGLTGAVLSSFSFGTPFTPLSMIVIQDLNRNRFPELGVLGTDATGEVLARVIDSGTGAPTWDDVLFRTGSVPISLGLLPDMNRNRVPELALLEQLPDGSHAVEVVDPSSGVLVRDVPLSRDHIPRALLTQRRGAELFVLGVDPAGPSTSVQVKNLRQDRRSRLVLFEGLTDPLAMLHAGGLGRRSFPGLAVLGRDSLQAPVIMIKNSRNGLGATNLTVP